MSDCVHGTFFWIEKIQEKLLIFFQLLLLSSFFFFTHGCIKQHTSEIETNIHFTHCEETQNHGYSKNSKPFNDDGIEQSSKWAVQRTDEATGTTIRTACSCPTVQWPHEKDRHSSEQWGHQVRYCLHTLLIPFLEELNWSTCVVFPLALHTI